MKKEDIKELYSITQVNGVYVLVKINTDFGIERRGEYSLIPELLVNPKIDFSDGVLNVSGEKLEFIRIREFDKWNNWEPIPISELKKNWNDWKDLIFYGNYILI